MVLVDRQPLLFDPLTNLLPAVALRGALEAGTAEAWRHWIAVTDFRPPLSSVVYQPGMWLLSNQVHAVRLTDLALFLLVIWQVAWIGRRLCGPAAGFVAAALFASFPITLGWSIMGNADPLIWAVLLLLFRVLLWLDLRAPWQAMALGLAVGLCTATRLLCLVFLVAPFFWVLALKVRSGRAVLGLALAAGAAAAVSGWWYLMQFGAVLDNVVMSSETQVEEAQPEFHPLNYLADGFWLPLVGAALGAWVIWRRGSLDRPTRWLLGLWVAAPALQLGLVWDYWARYPLAALPQCALLAGIALDHLTRPWPMRRRVAAFAAALLLGLAPLAAYHAGAATLLPGVNSAGLGQDTGRVDMRYGAGLLRVDTQPHDALFRVLGALQPGAAVVLVNELTEPHYTRGIMLARRRPPYLLYGPPDPDMLHAKPEGVQARHILRVRPSCSGARPDHYLCDLYQPDPWFQETRQHLSLRLLSQARDPNGGWFRLYQLAEPL